MSTSSPVSALRSDAHLLPRFFRLQAIRLHELHIYPKDEFIPDVIVVILVCLARKGRIALQQTSRQALISSLSESNYMCAPDPPSLGRATERKRRNHRDRESDNFNIPNHCEVIIIQSKRLTTYARPPTTPSPPTITPSNPLTQSQAPSPSVTN